MSMPARSVDDTFVRSGDSADWVSAWTVKALFERNQPKARPPDPTPDPTPIQADSASTSSDTRDKQVRKPEPAILLGLCLICIGVVLIAVSLFRNDAFGEQDAKEQRRVDQSNQFNDELDEMAKNLSRIDLGGRGQNSAERRWERPPEEVAAKADRSVVYALGISGVILFGIGVLTCALSVNSKRRTDGTT